MIDFYSEVLQSILYFVQYLLLLLVVVVRIWIVVVVV